MVKMNARLSLLLLAIVVNCIQISDSIRCYQCSSAEGNRDLDTCGAYESFDPEINIPVDCQDYESYTPGTFCVKLTQQGPRGFIWDGRWRAVIRRCASVSDTGVTGVCNWGVYENGVYWEECYCSEDSCNKSTRHTALSALITGVGILLSVWFSL